MREPKIQPLTPLRLAGAQVGRALLGAHARPHGLLVLVAVDIVGLGAQEDDDGEQVDGKQLGVAVPVVGLVRVDVDERVRDVPDLDGYLFFSSCQYLGMGCDTRVGRERR